MSCTAAAYKDSAKAREVSRTLRRWHLSVGVVLCEECDQYHLQGDVKRLRIPKRGMTAIRYIAMGFTQQETAKITGIGHAAIDWYIRELKLAFGAMTTTHLVAILIALGVLDPCEFVPSLTGRNHENGGADNGKRRSVQRNRTTAVLPSV